MRLDFAAGSLAGARSRLTLKSCPDTCVHDRHFLVAVYRASTGSSECERLPKFREPAGWRAPIPPSLSEAPAERRTEIFRLVLPYWAGVLDILGLHWLRGGEPGRWRGGW